MSSAAIAAWIASTAVAAAVLDGRGNCVSRGPGCERGHAPRVRFNAPPEVSLLTLRSQATQP